MSGLLWLASHGGVAAQGHAEDGLPSPLRLEHVQRYARAHRAEITAARARATAAAQRPAIVSALEDPMLSPSVDHLPFGMGGADLSLAVEQRFPLSKILGHRRRAAEAETSRLRAESQRAGLDIELDAALAFFMLQERRQMEQVLDQQLVLARELVSAANARYSGGTGAQPDVLRAEIEVSRLEGTLRAVHAEVRAAEAMLNASLALPAGGQVPRLESAATEAVPADWSATRSAAERRPELSASRAEIARAEADVSVMKSMYAPMATVRTGPAYTMVNGTGWMLMLGVSVPVWRNRLNAGVREAQAMLAMSRAELSAMARMIEGQAASTRERVLAARERFLAWRDEVVPRAQRAIDPTLAGYAAGRLPLVSVVEAVQTLWPDFESDLPVLGTRSPCESPG
jgi:cobalt-zinc-cadmium efflux system outer membrane protein